MGERSRARWRAAARWSLTVAAVCVASADLISRLTHRGVGAYGLYEGNTFGLVQGRFAWTDLEMIGVDLDYDIGGKSLPGALRLTDLTGVVARRYEHPKLFSLDPIQCEFYFAVVDARLGSSYPAWPLTSALLMAAGTVWSRRIATRVRPGHCPRCHYDLAGNVTGICPECGSPA